MKGIAKRYLRRGVMGAAALMVASTVACVEPIRVRTAIAPDVSFSRDRTFRFLPVATSSYTSPGADAANDPVLVNSITGRAVRHDIARALEDRGYSEARDSADLGIAYYIGSRTRLYVRRYEYGYPFWGWIWRWGPEWGGWPTRGVVVYERGTVIVDLLDGAGKRLLWRGVGVSDVPDDPRDYAAALGKTVRAIMHRFPGRPDGPPWSAPVALRPDSR